MADESNARLTKRVDKLEKRVGKVEQTQSVLKGLRDDVKELTSAVQEVREKLARWSIPVAILIGIITVVSTAAILGVRLESVL